METPLEIFALSLYSIFHIVLSYVHINTNLSASLKLLQCLSPPATPCPWISDPPAFAAVPHMPMLGTGVRCHRGCAGDCPPSLGFAITAIPSQVLLGDPQRLAAG